MNIQPPYRIGISTYNGIIDNQQYIDSIEIYKLSVLNKDIDKKHLHAVKERNLTEIYTYYEGEVYINLQYLNRLAKEADIVNSLINDFIQFTNEADKKFLKEISNILTEIKILSDQSSISQNYVNLLDKLYTLNITQTLSVIQMSKVEGSPAEKIQQLEEYLRLFNKTSTRIIEDYEKYIFPYKQMKTRALALLLPVFVGLLYLLYRRLADRIIKEFKPHVE
jgi:hypothetical protein